MTVQRQDAGYPAWDALTDRAGSLALTTVTRGACHAQLRTVARDTAAPLPRSISTVDATDRHGLITPPHCARGALPRRLDA